MRALSGLAFSLLWTQTAAECDYTGEVASRSLTFDLQRGHVGDVAVRVGGEAAILAPELRGHDPKEQSPPLDLEDGHTDSSGGWVD